MDRSFIAASVVAAFLCCAAPVSAQWDNLLAQMATVSDEALNSGLAGDQSPEVVATKDCDIDKAQVARFDKLLGLSAEEQNASRKRHARFGVPIATKSDSEEEFLINREYVINYNGNLRIPVYAVYLLTAKDVIEATREKCFREDLRLADGARSVLLDYVEPVFDRGHLVPRADMNRSRAVMINTFVLSNMMPQHSRFNQGIWGTLETAVRAWTRAKGTVTIITGAVFDRNGDGVRDAAGDAERVRPTKRVAVPTHFYKIVLHETPTGFIETISIMLRHTEGKELTGLKPQQRLAILEDGIVSIKEIEALTGYDFLPDLPSPRREAVKRAIAPGLWQ